MKQIQVKETLDRWLQMLISIDGADLHVKTNSPLHARHRSNIVKLTEEVATQELMEELVPFLTGESYESFLSTGEYDGAYTLNEKHRFRFNIYLHVNGVAIAFRLIPDEIHTFEELHLPEALNKLVDLRRGLVLITGTTGSGKTTTLSTIIENINRKYARHIITIEDPVEYVFHDKNSIIEQRELGSHTKSFSIALRAAMREDPDIIVVGEVRDMATAEAIVHAVNTGHLVFSTMHTTDAKETIERIIGFFPADEQNRVRLILSSTLEATVSQRLIEGVDEQMIPAVEMMFKSPLIQELIRSKRDIEIPDAIEKEGISYQSMSFNRALFELTLSGKITEAQAYQYATSPADLKLMFTLSAEYAAKKLAEEDELQLKEHS
jgi:twitching motility protein PilT